MSGWIKLHRQFKTRGHFHMPDRAMKIWFYILLTVSHRDNPRWGVGAGEGWISYDNIAEECSVEGQRMSRKSIARELQWLEGNGYISRFVIKGKGQKIRVNNWDLYQSAEDRASNERPAAGGVSSDSEPQAEPQAELVAEPQAEHIQEVKEPKEPKKTDPPHSPPAGGTASSPPSDVEAFHAHYCERWRDVFPRGPRLTPQRRRKIIARLRTFSLDELRRAVDNLHKSPYHRGDNPQGTAYGTIDFLIRNDEQIDKWANTPPIRAAPGRPGARRESAVTRMLRQEGVTFGDETRGFDDPRSA